jgi:hypothetical protein
MSEEVEVEATAPKKGDPNAEAAKYRKLARQYKDRVAELEGQLAAAPAPDEAAAARIAELEDKIRHRDHTDAFRRLAAEKIRPDALDDAYTLSGWQADADEVDEAAMTTTIESLIAQRSYLAVPAAEAPQVEGHQPSPQATRSISQLRPVPAKGSGRGATPTTPINTTTRNNRSL